jgi:hypothetical protein
MPFRNTLGAVAVMVTAILLAYFPLLTPGDFVNPDGQLMIPLLQELEGPFDYLQKLITFRTLDVQPLRDLSLLFDLWVFNRTGWNISVLHNLLLWLVCGALLHRIIQRSFPTLGAPEQLLWVVAFLVYPLFSQTLGWGAARKHLLALTFILIATHRWLRQEPGPQWRNTLIITFAYAASVLSQPIGILWPLWALGHRWGQSSEAGKRALLTLLPAGIVMSGMALVNLAYYSSSEVFLSRYGAKTDELVEIGDKVLALGHYAFQLAFPYLLSFNYTLGHWSTLTGLALAVGFGCLLLLSRIDRSWVVSWLGFAALPLLVVMTKSSHLYDTYLLIPAVGVLILLLGLRQLLPLGKSVSILLLILSCIWVIVTQDESRGWKDEILLTQRSFERRPSCMTAGHYLRISYENGQRPKSPDAKQFIFQNECQKFTLTGADLIGLQTYLLYYETDLPLEKRLENLRILAGNSVLSAMALAALHIREGQLTDARSTIAGILERWGEVKYRPEHSPIVADVIYPFCAQEQDAGCLEFMKSFITKPSAVTYK